MDICEFIENGKSVIGIEFGSTRIKAVMVGEDFAPIASGVFDWQNSLENGVWTYQLPLVREGLQGAFADLKRDVSEKYGARLTSATALGISAMMHGYLAFDKDDELLVPFRTWRNSMTGRAASELSSALEFNIPERWSAAHLYQAVLNGEEHISRVKSINTLAGYVHFLLTGRKVIGMGDASGMFPIAPDGSGYDKQKLAKFDELTAGTALREKLIDLLPEIVSVGECAGRLTEEGARLLDPSGEFKAGTPFCPPEGDAQTGMTATNSITPKTGNVSAGTSIFAMAVLEKPLENVHREIDIVTTPDGAPVAMVHCNNCATDLDAWFKVFGELLSSMGVGLKKGELYDRLYAIAAEGDTDCGGVVSYNYYSGEQVTQTAEGRPMLLRRPDSSFTVRNLLRSLVYSTMTTLKIGMDILADEGVQLDRIYAHGGLFKTPEPSRSILAAALDCEVTLMKTAGEGGAWGIALLAAFMAHGGGLSLNEFLNEHVFAGAENSSVSPDREIAAGLEKYMSAYKSGLDAERAAARV